MDGRQNAMSILTFIEAALLRGDVRQLAQLTTSNFFGPIQTIIPWATNHYTQTLIERVREHFGPAFWGFLMLGGMSGGGMGFIVEPGRKSEAQDYLQELMSATKRQLQQRPALRHGAGRVRFLDQRFGHRGHALGRRRGPHVARLLRDVRAGMAPPRHPRVERGRPQRN